MASGSAHRDDEPVTERTADRGGNGFDGGNGETPEASERPPHETLHIIAAISMRPTFAADSGDNEGVATGRVGGGAAEEGRAGHHGHGQLQTGNCTCMQVFRCRELSFGP